MDFALLGRHGEERLRIRLLVARERSFHILPSLGSGDVAEWEVQEAHLTLDEREVLHDLDQSFELNLYVPSHAQFPGLSHEMVTRARKCLNFPVPPENVAVPVRVTRLRST